MSVRNVPITSQWSNPTASGVLVGQPGAWVKVGGDWTFDETLPVSSSTGIASVSGNDVVLTDGVGPQLVDTWKMGNAVVVLT